MRGPRTRTTRLRTWAVGLACGLCLTAGCSSKPTPPREGGASGSKADKARKDAEAIALNAVNAGATAQAKAVPEARSKPHLPFNVALGPTSTSAKAPPSPAAQVPPNAPAPPSSAVPVAVAPKATPRPGSPAVVRERVVSTVHTIEADADADALAQARDLVERKLAELDPPVRYKPSITEVKAEFLRKDSRTVRPPDADERETFARYGVTGTLVYVEYDIEVTADQVRELRSQERSGAALRLLGVLAAVALAGFLFLRADEWTRGYLTSWLAIAAVVLAGGAAAALIFV